MQPLTVAGICTLPDLSTAATDGKTKPAQMEIHTSHIQDQKVTEPESISCAKPHHIMESEGEGEEELIAKPNLTSEEETEGEGAEEEEEGDGDEGGGSAGGEEDETLPGEEDVEEHGEGEEVTGGGWMNGGQTNGNYAEMARYMAAAAAAAAEAHSKPNGNSATKDEIDDPVTMVISPDLPFHLLSPSPEDVEDMEEDLEAEDLLEAVDDEGNDDGKVYTDSLSEMCLCVCKVCNTKMKFNSLREHVRIQHNLRMTEYKLKYGKIAYSRMTYHRCKACGKVLRAIYATIKKHLQTVHNLQFKEYANRYHVFKGKFDKVEDISTIEDKIYSDDPSQMCMTVCKVCNMNLEPYNMKNHVKGKHYLSMLEYKTNFGEIKFITEIFHKCKVCHKCVLFEYQKLSNHMFFNHGIGIAKYKDFLLGKLSLGSLKQMEAEAMKSKSTKNGSHEDARSKSYNDDLRLNKAKRLRTSPFNGGYNPYSSHHQNLFMLPGHHRGAGGGPPGGAHPSLALLQSIQDSHKYFHSVQEKSGMQQMLENYQALIQNQMLIQQTLAAKAASSSSSSLLGGGSGGAAGSSQQLAAAQALLLSSLAARGSSSAVPSNDTASLLSSLAGRGSGSGGSGVDAATLLSTLAARGTSADTASLLNSLAGRGSSGSDAAALLSSLAAREASSSILKTQTYAALQEENKKFESGSEEPKPVSSP